MSYYYYDLNISEKMSNNLFKIISSKRLTKSDTPITDQESYSILYKALTTLDANPDQAAMISLLPPPEYSPENIIKLNEIIDGIEYKGTRVELIEVYNANTNESDHGTLAYLKIDDLNPIKNYYRANLFTYTEDNITLAKIQLDIIDFVIRNGALKDLIDLDSIKSEMQGFIKLGVPYDNAELIKIIDSFNIDYRVLGNF